MHDLQHSSNTALHKNENATSLETDVNGHVKLLLYYPQTSFLSRLWAYITFTIFPLLKCLWMWNFLTNAGCWCAVCLSSKIHNQLYLFSLQPLLSGRDSLSTPWEHETLERWWFDCIYSNNMLHVQTIKWRIKWRKIIRSLC